LTINVSNAMKFAGIPLTIPNVLTLYRIVTFPLLVFMLYVGNEFWFALLLCINLITDILDGLIARLLNQVTALGAKLDSIADNGTYIMAFSGIFVFKLQEIGHYFPHIIAMLSLFLAANLLSLIKFKMFPSLHLYSWKIGGYLQGIFFFLLFALGFYPWYFWLMWVWSMCAFSEHIIIQLIIPSMLVDAKGLYWVLKTRSPKAP
jgi:cardiolipin synthase